MSNTLIGLIVLLGGLFALVGTALNWRIVTHEGKLFNVLFGDRVARGIYMVVGVIVIMLGIGLIFGVDWIK